MSDQATGDSRTADRTTADEPPAESALADGASPAFRTVVSAVRVAVAGGASMTEDAPSPGNTESTDGIPVSGLSEADWERVHAIAHRHQVVPLVYEGLTAADAPDSTVDPLREVVQGNARRNLQSTTELLRVLESFEDAGVRAIPVKGPVLAAVAYGDLNRRTFGDLDVLVPSSDAVTAGRILRGDGYDPGEEFLLVQRFGSDCPLLADVNECSFHHGRHGEVELRWRHGHWANPLAATFDGWWSRRETTTLAGREVPVLSPEDRLLLLATHANKHAWRRLAWLADVAATLRAHEDLDWDALERRAETWGVTPAVHVAIALAESLSEDVAGTVPAAVRRRVSEDRLAGVLADRAANRLARNPLGAPSRLEEVTFDLAATGSVRAVPRSTGRVAAASIRQLLRAVSDRTSS